jgi:hypothetical protein
LFRAKFRSLRSHDTLRDLKFGNRLGSGPSPIAGKSKEDAI